MTPAALRGEGNALFARKDYAGAAARYTQALELMLASGSEDADETCKLLSNRVANCHLEQPGQGEAALADARAALALLPAEPPQPHADQAGSPHRRRPAQHAPEDGSQAGAQAGVSAAASSPSSTAPAPAAGPGLGPGAPFPPGGALATLLAKPSMADAAEACNLWKTEEGIALLLRAAKGPQLPPARAQQAAADAEVLVVAPEGGGHHTTLDEALQAAQRAASPATTILLLGGVHRGLWVVPRKQLNLMGVAVGACLPKVRCDMAYGWRLTGGDFMGHASRGNLLNCWSPGSRLSARGLALELRMPRPQGGGCAAVAMMPGSGPHSFEHCTFEAPAGPNLVCIGAAVSVVGCSFAGAAGMVCAEGATVVVRACTFEGLDCSGIEARARGTRLTISGCTFKGVAPDCAIKAHAGCEAVAIADTTFEGCGGRKPPVLESPAVMLACCTADLRNMRITGSGANGAVATQGCQLSAVDCTVSGSRHCGFTMESAYGTLDGCTSTGNGNIGFALMPPRGKTAALRGCK